MLVYLVESVDIQMPLMILKNATTQKKNQFKILNLISLCFNKKTKTFLFLSHLPSRDSSGSAKSISCNGFASVYLSLELKPKPNVTRQTHREGEREIERFTYSQM